MTTTELRTRSAELVRLLGTGASINLIHRSRIIAEIEPRKSIVKPLTAEDIATIKKMAGELNLPKLSYKEREKRYRRHLTQRYGQSLS